MSELPIQTSSECIIVSGCEFKLLLPIRHHVAHYLEQFEAHMETRKLTKIAKALEKQLKRQDKLKKHEQEFVAQKAQPAPAQQQ
jgi:hypothetical protein